MKIFISLFFVEGKLLGVKRWWKFYLPHSYCCKDIHICKIYNLCFIWQITCPGNVCINNNLVLNFDTDSDKIVLFLIQKRLAIQLKRSNWILLYTALFSWMSFCTDFGMTRCTWCMCMKQILSQEESMQGWGCAGGGPFEKFLPHPRRLLDSNLRLQ